MTVPDDISKGAAEWIIQILAGMPIPGEKYSQQYLKETDLRDRFLERVDFEAKNFDEGLQYESSSGWVRRLQQNIVLTKEGWHILPKPYEAST